MTISLIIFIAILIVLGVYLMLKQREVDLGTQGALSRALSEKSPVFESRFNMMMNRFDVWRVRASEKSKDFSLHGAAKARATLRGAVVLVAAKMVRLVRGEKLLLSHTAPSLYLKRLKNEMDKPEEEHVKDSVSE